MAVIRRYTYLIMLLEGIRYCTLQLKSSLGKPSLALLRQRSLLTTIRQSYRSKTILIVYGGEGEQHELAVSNGEEGTLSEGDGVQMGKRNGATVLNWSTSSSRRVVQLGCGLTIYILGTFLDERIYVQATS